MIQKPFGVRSASFFRHRPSSASKRANAASAQVAERFGSRDAGGAGRGGGTDELFRYARCHRYRPDSLGSMVSQQRIRAIASALDSVSAEPGPQSLGAQIAPAALLESP